SQVVDIQCYSRIMLFECAVTTAFRFFFFDCSADHRDLHSFPTRRSSDLHARWHPHRLAECLGPRPPKQHRTDHAHHRRSPRPRQDRKSTRLNSSHRTISYAVFCLKKKNHHSKPPLNYIRKSKRPNYSGIL